MKYVIRSMSTTNLPHPVPYHIYLMRLELRTEGWWSQSKIKAQVFDSLEEAEEEWLRRWPADHLGRMDIAPINYDGPPVWEAFYHRPKDAA